MTDPIDPMPPARPGDQPAPMPPVSPPWAVPAGGVPADAMPPGASGWAYVPSMGWVQFAASPTPPAGWGPPSAPPPQVAPAPQAPAQTWAPPAPAPSPWAVTAPAAPAAVPAVAPALPLEPVVRSTTSTRGRGRPSAYGMILGVALLLAVGGVGFAAGRMSAPASTTPSGAALGALAARNGFTPGQGAATTTGTADTTTTGSGTTTGTGTGTGSTADADTPTATLAPDQSGGTGTPGQGGFAGGGPGGFGGGGFGLTGTVTAVGDGTITIETQNGGTQEITTDDTTTYHVEQAASAEDVTVGTSVRVTTSGGFPGRGRQSDPAAAINASDVLVLQP